MTVNCLSISEHPACPQVYLTDGDESALKLASSNVSLNEQLWAGSTEGQPVQIGNDPHYVLQDVEFADIGRRLHPMLLRWGLPLPVSGTDMISPCCALCLYYIISRRTS